MDDGNGKDWDPVGPITTWAWEKFTFSLLS